MIADMNRARTRRSSQLYNFYRLSGVDVTSCLDSATLAVSAEL